MACSATLAICGRGDRGFSECSVGNVAAAGYFLPPSFYGFPTAKHFRGSFDGVVGIRSARRHRGLASELAAGDAAGLDGGKDRPADDSPGRSVYKPAHRLDPPAALQRMAGQYLCSVLSAARLPGASVGAVESVAACVDSK